MDAPLVRLLGEADRAVARLDGMAEVLPNPELFVTMYSRKEALLSSQIEGTQASIVDVLECEAAGAGASVGRAEVQEVLNHQRALTFGLERLDSLPVSARLLNEMHAVLMQDVRGQTRRVGEFRTNQNWIGPPGCSLREATFVPPPVPAMKEAMSDLQRYIHQDDETPILVKVALAHHEFETIHPYEDGNGRMGRLLITLLLMESGVLSRPLLYLSLFLKEHRQEYYDLLNIVRFTGAYEGWITFFLRGVREVALSAAKTARTVLDMRDSHIESVRDAVASAHGSGFVDVLLRRSAITVASASEDLGVSYGTANTLIRDFERLGLLREITGRRRNRVFLYEPYIEVLGGRLEP
jgi:Fic family protein